MEEAGLGSLCSFGWDGSGGDEAAWGKACGWGGEGIYAMVPAGLPLHSGAVEF